VFIIYYLVLDNNKYCCMSFSGPPPGLSVKELLSISSYSTEYAGKAIFVVLVRFSKHENVLKNQFELTLNSDGHF